VMQCDSNVDSESSLIGGFSTEDMWEIARTSSEPCLRAAQEERSKFRMGSFHVTSYRRCAK
jgi:hypothetical protein